MSVVRRRTVFDSLAAKLPMRPAVRPKVDFGEFFPHHGRTQLIVHGVSPRAYNHAYEGNVGIPALNADEKAASGIYGSRMTFTQEPPPLWQFAP